MFEDLSCSKQNKASQNCRPTDSVNQIKLGPVCYILTGHAPVCGPKNAYECGFSAFYKYAVNNLASQCNCPRQCQQLTYSYSISQAEFSNHAVEWMQSDRSLANKAQDEIRRNYATLEVSTFPVIGDCDKHVRCFPIFLTQRVNTCWCLFSAESENQFVAVVSGATLQ